MTVQPDANNGLSKPPQVMIGKAMTLRRERIGTPFGVAGDQLMLEVSRLRAVFLGAAH